VGGDRVRLLDLFCGAGGAAMGYAQAGFDEIVGVDIAPQPNYPFTFVQKDVRTLTEKDLAGFDLYHASPPCQPFSTMTRNHDRYDDLVETTRNILWGKPYVIENVPGAPLEGWVIELCGSMFGLDVQRHRRFEMHGFTVMAPGGCNHKEWKEGRPWTITGKLDGQEARYDHSWKPSLEDARRLMEMPWIQTAREVAEAIPPAYTRFIGEQFLDQWAVTG
jgi:hypothetical protein